MNIKPLNLLLVFVLILIVSFTANAQSEIADSCSAHANDRVPKFRIAKRHRVGDKFGFQLMISLAPKDITQANLVANGCNLGKEYRKEPFLQVWFFDDHHAAKAWELQHETGNRETNLALRGSYGFSRERHEQNLTWFYHPPDWDRYVKINLGKPPLE
jgi:hypothetical protein